MKDRELPVNHKDYSQPIMKVFLSYFRPHWKLFALDLSCALAASLIDLAFPLVARRGMYDLLPARAFDAFFMVMAVFVAAFLLKAVLQFIITYWGHMFGVRVEADLREDLFVHIQSLDFEFFDRNRTGQLLSRMTGDLFEITELSHHGPEDLFIASVTIIGAIIIMFTIQWKLALLILILIPLFLVIVLLCRRNMVLTSKRVKVKLAEINGEIESGLSGVRTSKAFANEKADYNKFAEANEQFKTAKCDNYKAFGRFNSSLEYFMSIMPVAVMAFGGWLIMRDQMNYADMITFYLYISTFINPIRKLGNFMEIFMNGWAGLTRFIGIMRTQPQIVDAPDALPLENVQGQIERRRFASWFPDFMTWTKAAFASTGRMYERSVVSPCERTSESCSRMCSCSPTRSRRTSGTAIRRQMKRRSARLQRLQRSMMISWVCRTASTPMWESGACGCPEDRNSGSRSRGSF